MFAFNPLTVTGVKWAKKTSDGWYSNSGIIFGRGQDIVYSYSY